MIIGEPSDISIEVYHEPHDPRWTGFGRIAVTIEHVRLGDIQESHCSLFHGVDRFRELSWDIGSLWHPSFNGLPDAAIFDVIDRALYSGEPEETGPEYVPFDFLTNTGEPFDSCKTFIVCRPGGQVHVLYQLFRDEIRGSACCSAASFQRVARSLVHWFDEQIAATACS